MAELLSIKTSADKEDIHSTSDRHLAIYRHLEQFLIAFTCEKDNEKDTCFTKPLPFCNPPLEINRLNKQSDKIEKSRCFQSGLWGLVCHTYTEHFNRKNGLTITGRDQSLYFG